MSQRIENLSSASLLARVRSVVRVAGGVAVLLGASGVPLQRLQSVETRHEAVIDAQARLNRLRSEARAFEAAGGFGRIEELRETLRHDLPKGLSRVDVRALVTLAAEAAGLRLETLAVGSFEEAPFPRLDDAIGRAEVGLTGHGTAQELADLVALLTRLGYPTTLLDVRLVRSSESDARFELQATFAVHQSIPLPATSPEDDSDTEMPK